MNNWQKELENKFNEIKKEEKHVSESVSQSRRNSNRGSSSIDGSNTSSHTSNNHGGGSSSILRRGVSAETRTVTKDERGKNLMITREAALDDLEKLEAEATDEQSKLIVKVAKVLVKVLATIRSNQLLTDAEKARIKEARANKKPDVKA
jgi:hypothetical protein